MHDIDAAAIEAQLAEFFAGLTVLRPVSSPGRILHGRLIAAPNREGWLAQARDFKMWATDAERGHNPHSAAEMRTLAARCRNLAEGRAIGDGGTP